MARKRIKERAKEKIVSFLMVYIFISIICESLVLPFPRNLKKHDRGVIKSCDALLECNYVSFQF